MQSALSEHSLTPFDSFPEPVAGFVRIGLPFEIPGLGDARDTCTDVQGYISCPDGHTKIPLRNTCQRVECPECYLTWCRKAGHRISERLRGVRSAYWHTRRNEYKKVRSMRHFVFSPPPGLLEPGISLDDAFQCWRSFHQIWGVLEGGCVIFHPYRLRDDVIVELKEYMSARGSCASAEREAYADGGYWRLAHLDVLGIGDMSNYVEWGPHYHVLGFGFVAVKSDVLYERSGWVYSNLGARSPGIRVCPESGVIVDEVDLTARYQLSHAGVERGPSGKYRNAYRWFGVCSVKNCKLDRTPVGTTVVRLTVNSVLLCPVCGRYLTMSTDCVTGDVTMSEEWLELLDDRGVGGVYIRKQYRRYALEVMNES